MQKPNLIKMLTHIKAGVSKRSPELLTAIGITTMLTTVVLAVKATPKAIILMEEKKKECDIAPEEALSPVETVKATWKCYLPAATTGIVSVACLIGGQSVSARRSAALATAYKLSETAFSEYKEKVVETIGEKRDKDIKDRIAKDRVDNNPVSKSEVIVSSKGDSLCYDVLSGRYFNSDIEKIRKAANELNRRMTCGEMYVSLSEFYNEIGLPPNKLSGSIGWRVDHGLIEVGFSSQIADDGRPCLVVDYMVAPEYDYQKLI